MRFRKGEDDNFDDLESLLLIKDIEFSSTKGKKGSMYQMNYNINIDGLSESDVEGLKKEIFSIKKPAYININSFEDGKFLILGYR